MRDRKADNLNRKQLRLEQCAWANRRELTPSEARLWSALKARQLGVQFRREVPLAGRYIVDFCAPSVRLVVEVDGGCHASRPRGGCAPGCGASRAWVSCAARGGSARDAQSGGCGGAGSLGTHAVRARSNYWLTQIGISRRSRASSAISHAWFRSHCVPGAAQIQVGQTGN